MDNNSNTLIDNKKFSIFLTDKEQNSVFTLITICVNPLKNIFKILKDVFTSVTLKIQSDGILCSNPKWSKTSKVKVNEMSSIFFFSGILHDTPLIRNDRCEKYNCSADTILINLDTNDLEQINKRITDESVVYLFVDKEDYNSETNYANCIKCYIYDYEVSMSEIIIHNKKSDK